MTKISIFLMIWIATIGLSAQSDAIPHDRPTFSDYAVKKIYKGKPAAPNLSDDYRFFRTRIKYGAAQPVQFAGHYTVPRWGCGAGCSTFVIVDSMSGKIYDGSGVVDLPFTWLDKHPNGLADGLRWEFHPDSRLFKIDGCINEKDCGYYDYIMEEGKGLKLIRKQLLPPEFQP